MIPALPPPAVIQSHAAHAEAANSGAVVYSWEGEYAGRSGNVTATLPITNPKLGPNANHTNVEICAQGPNGAMVEVGVIKDPTDGSGLSTPHLFATYWVGGQLKDYQTYGAVANGSASFTLIYWNGSWVAKVGSRDLLKSPESLWGGKFTPGTVQTQQAFSEHQSVRGDGTGFIRGRVTWSTSHATAFGGATPHAGWFQIN